MNSFAVLRISYAGLGDGRFMPATPEPSPPEPSPPSRWIFGLERGEMRQVLVVGDILVLCSMVKSMGPRLIKASSWGIRDINDYIYY